MHRCTFATQVFLRVSTHMCVYALYVCMSMYIYTYVHTYIYIYVFMYA